MDQIQENWDQLVPQMLLHPVEAVAEVHLQNQKLPQIDQYYSFCI
jgi:hypothetical protein